MNDKTLLGGMAILALALIESVALATGHDGQYLVLIAMLIAGVAGYSLAQTQFMTACDEKSRPAAPMPTAQQV